MLGLSILPLPKNTKLGRAAGRKDGKTQEGELTVKSGKKVIQLQCNMTRQKKMLAMIKALRKMKNPATREFS